MKPIGFAALSAALCLSSLPVQAFVLSQGESRVIELTGFSLASTNASNYDQFGFFIGTTITNDLGYGDSLTVKVFENVAVGNPLFTYTFAPKLGPTPGTSFYPTSGFGLGTQLASGVWNDLQGVLELVMNTGSIEIDTLIASTLFSTNRYQTDNLLASSAPPQRGAVVDVVGTVEEPGALALLTTAGALLGAFSAGGRRSRRPSR